MDCLEQTDIDCRKWTSNYMNVIENGYFILSLEIFYSCKIALFSMCLFLLTLYNVKSFIICVQKLIAFTLHLIIVKFEIMFYIYFYILLHYK